jgi:hypothetical protein
MHRSVAVGTFCVAAVLAACTSASAPKTPVSGTTPNAPVTISTASPTPSPSSSASNTSVSSSPVSPAPPLGDGLIGFGASDSAWNAHHIPDPNPKITPGSSYDPDPNLKTISSNGDKYIGVIHGDGRVVQYSLESPSRTTRAEAINEIILEFPSDLKIIWQKQFDTCYQVEFHSATLAKQVPPSDLRSGYVTVAFVHYDADANPVSDTTVIDEAILGQLPAAPTLSAHADC